MRNDSPNENVKALSVTVVNVAAITTIVDSIATILTFLLIQKYTITNTEAIQMSRITRHKTATEITSFNDIFSSPSVILLLVSYLR